MSHHIYHTEAFVLGSANTGEANKYIFLFTRELGVVAGAAQSVRSIASKLRFSLQDFSYTRVDLVKGKQIWRITNAERKDEFANLFADKEKKKVYVKILGLIRRLCSDEEPNEVLFDVLVDSFTFFEKESFTPETLEGFELVVLVHILKNLGYLRDFAGMEEILNMKLSHELFVIAQEKRKLLIAEINHALQESQL